MKLSEIMGSRPSMSDQDEVPFTFFKLIMVELDQGIFGTPISQKIK